MGKLPNFADVAFDYPSPPQFMGKVSLSDGGGNWQTPEGIAVKKSYSPSDIPVSYTHLDVYKRQIL